MHDLVLLALVFLVGALYASVGNAGASGFIAVMALLGAAPETMKPTALALNIVVATISTINFQRAGHFYPRPLVALAAGSVPLAFVGGAIPPSGWYDVLVAVVLAIAGVRAVGRRPTGESTVPEPRAPWVPAVVIGAAIGFLSGLTGTGGGILLTPVLVALGWATVRQSAGIAAPFILVNSIAGLAGTASTLPAITLHLFAMVAAAAVGGFLGSWAGANRLPERPLSIALGIVLLAAAAKLAFF